MTDVFVSRPLNLPDEFQKALDGLLEFMVSQGLTPRTLGVSEYTIENPLDAVIDMVDECDGAVILGYPQFEISKVEEDEPVHVSSPWNHIEAALVYDRGKPMMIVTHTDVNRGIFDRGTTGKIVAQEDLADAGWPLHKQIIGGLVSLKKQINLSKSNDQTVTTSGQERLTAVSEEHVRALKLVSDRERATESDVANALGLKIPKAKFYVDELYAKKLIDFSLNFVGGTSSYYVTAAGRRLLNMKGLLD